MPSGTVIAEFPATPNRVWSIMTDLENAPSWVPDLVSVQRIDAGAMRVGSKFSEVMNVQGRRTEVTVTIEEFDAPRLIAHTGNGKSIKITGRATLVETPNGCRVTNEWGLELSGLLKLASPLAANWTRNNIEQSMKALARELERR